MKAEMINKLVETSLNPYMVFYVELNHTKEECDDLYKKAKDIITKDFLKKFSDNVLDIDLSHNASYVLIKQNFVNEFKNIMDIIGFDYTMVEAIDELWEMNDLTLLLDNNDPAPEITAMMGFENDFLDGLKTIIERRYSLDDVLDKISKSGYQSLNMLNKYILDKKSR